MGLSPWNSLVSSRIPSPRNNWLDGMVKFPVEGLVMAPTGCKFGVLYRT